MIQPFSPKIQHIQGMNDSVVPPESLDVRFANETIIEDGDHDLEKPRFQKKSLDQVTYSNSHDNIDKT